MGYSAHLQAAAITLLTLAAVPLQAQPGFEVDTSEQPSTHPPISPENGEVVAVNPPAMVWRADERAAVYELELARDESFTGPVIRVEDIDLPFYNHDEVLQEGEWYWRYYVITDSGERSRPGPVRKFEVPVGIVELPVPTTGQILETMPGHPRIFTTPEELEAFRQRRHGPAAEAWERVRLQADEMLEHRPELPGGLISLDDRRPAGPTPGMEGRWQEGEDVRRQVIWLMDETPYWSPDYVGRDLNADASWADLLSFAYLISGERAYAEAAKEWLLMIADARVDYHLEDRAHHDTVVYNYEDGLKHTALTFDRIYDYLGEEDRSRVLDHIEFHGEAAYEWLREGVDIHIDYQQSHPQQCMHALLTTTMAVAPYREAFQRWADYLIRQYVNRIAWTSSDGGYFEGQTYAHKFRWILEGLVAMRTATGLDLFSKPNVYNSGRFWLYAMSLNYWFHHGGDVYSLLWPWGNSADAYITNLVASMNADPYLQWWSDTVFADPAHIPFEYLSATDLAPKPPVDLPRARVFPETGQLAAFDRIHDHRSDRIFFRSSQWGGHSHAHADQNNFVIHSGGEILAADPGYYTYYGDDYHIEWSASSFTHNSILVNGEGQPLDIDAKGEISAFFHSPDYTFFAGDASRAYERPLERFERAVLFIRPGFYVIYDELAADEPADFTWLLNVFQHAELDSQQQQITVRQQDQRMRVRHFSSSPLLYSQSNERQYPIMTRAWSRFTEAFPEPWLIRVQPEQPAEQERFLALLNTYNADAGDSVLDAGQLENDTTLGLVFESAIGVETVLFRRHLRNPERIAGNGLASDASMASLALDREGAVRRWIVADATSLKKEGRPLLRTQHPASVSVKNHGPAGRLTARIDSQHDQRVELRLDGERPGRVLIAPAESPEHVREPGYEWEEGILSLEIGGGEEKVLRVEPLSYPAESPDPLVLELSDGSGVRQIPVDVARDEDGALIGYTELEPGDPGIYRIGTNREESEILIQDHWDISRSVEGTGTVEGSLRSGTELFIRFRADRRPDRVRAELVESHSGEIVNLLRNGDFEEGIPDYPPRGWTVMPTRPHVEDPGPTDYSWPEWSREDAYSGESSLRFYRQKKAMGLRSQPMRLRQSGTYLLRFMARGDATRARVSVHGARDSGGWIDLEPGERWRMYEKELEMESGYTEIRIRMEEGDELDQVLWVDAMEFGPVAP